MQVIDPAQVRNHVISVPHSGTRTLQRWLHEEKGLTRGAGPHPDQPPGHWHFRLHPKEIKEFETHGIGRCHIPLRNPLNVTDSWERRHDNTGNHSQRALHQSFRLMIEFIDRNEDRVELYKMEDLPVLAGIGPRGRLNMDSKRIRSLVKYFRSERYVRDFFACYYSPDELRWM